MQQSYFGSLEAINDQRNIEFLKTGARAHPSSPREILRRKKKRVLNQTIQSVQPEPHESITVNISGKIFEITTKDMQKYPKSLLAHESRRKIFYDSEKNEYFLDHNRIIASCVETFYKYGCIDRPENIPEHLFVEELKFYGLYEYLDDGLKGQLDYVSNISETYYGANVREKLWAMFENPDGIAVNLCARMYNIFSLSVILFSIALLCYASHTDDENLRIRTNVFDNVNENWVFLSELVCIGFFSIELFLRFIVAYDKRRFFCSFLNIVDFVAIAPFYIGLLLDVKHVTAPLTVLRVLRIGKIFRVLKISRYNTSLLIIAKTVKSGRWDLWMLTFLLLILSILYGSMTYYIEQIFQGEDSEFESIPVGLWWALITTLSIGYGNKVPRSSVGRIIGSLCAVSGVIVVAPILPIMFNRWTRFNKLQHEAKLQKKYKKSVKSIQHVQDIDHLDLIRVKIEKKTKYFF